LDLQLQMLKVILIVITSALLMYRMQSMGCYFKGKTVPEGSMGCGNDRQFATCVFGEWQMTDCGKGTVCREIPKGHPVCK
jgi:hypothetical protein